jgi:hypothetical protein
MDALLIRAKPRISKSLHGASTISTWISNLSFRGGTSGRAARGEIWLGVPFFITEEKMNKTLISIIEIIVMVSWVAICVTFTILFM